MKVVGPSTIETVRGWWLGREVAVVCCGEAHDDAIHLTRHNAIVEPVMGWVATRISPASKGRAEPTEAIATRKSLTLQQAMDWAAQHATDMEEEEEEEEDDEESEGPADKDEAEEDEEEAGGGSNKAYLAFHSPPVASCQTRVPKGHAQVFAKRPAGRDLEAAARKLLSKDTTWGWALYCWDDTDYVAREFRRRRRQAEREHDTISHEEYDAVISSRKKERLEEGLQLFDDWLISKSRSARHEAGQPTVEVVLEAPVRARELEYHTFPAPKGEAPTGGGLAASPHCIRAMEDDSDSDSDDDDCDGEGSFLEYLQHRLESALDDHQVHCIDPRGMGDGENKDDVAAFKRLLDGSVVPQDPDQRELEDALVERSTSPASSSSSSSDSGEDVVIPSWEAFFGCVGELILYSPHVKVDFAPFLSQCVRDVETLNRFFVSLYFGTIEDAVATLHLGPSTLQYTRIRSPLRLTIDPSQPQSEVAAVHKRRSDHGYVPVKGAPLGGCLKAQGSMPPQTFASALGTKVRARGGGDLVDAAQAWYLSSVQKLLEDFRRNDSEGDYFLAWLRASHRDIYEDIDTSDPAEVAGAKWAPSRSSQFKHHNLRAMRMPSAREAFQALTQLDPTRSTYSAEQRTLAAIIVDAFQTRLVGLCAIVAAASAITKTQAGGQVVVVVYAGAEHARKIADFWRTTQGFTSHGLVRRGMVGKAWNTDFDEGEPRGLSLPAYLEDLRTLFPLPVPGPTQGSVENAMGLKLKQEAAERAMEELLALEELDFVGNKKDRRNCSQKDGGNKHVTSGKNKKNRKTSNKGRINMM
ncbi:hypothetical protein CYMTET_29450 [Cymbomonas tetramitiformis]|uniref:Uncharacterized protein n=1 Tax=Cymbomonas tetramitiformis TaxID=36881 RepID=A0AAE0FL22_9CHLO|nr:hypothetical protein CYMTET_29450 [Cymbomonas tetramitiformis]